MTADRKSTNKSCASFDNFEYLRKDFPILQQKNRGKQFVYLDSAASAQKPKCVVDAVAKFYLQDYANIHRGIYELSERATVLFEENRQKVARFINAAADEIIFTPGTTAGINLVAQSFGQLELAHDDEVIISEMEHHANIVPWYMLKEQRGISLKVIPVREDGSLDLEAFTSLISARTKLIAISHVSNALGIINPIKQMISIAQQQDIPVLIDGAQAVPHMPVDVKSLDCDFYVFSSHKVYGPTGLGVLYAKKKWLDKMPPYQGGGSMIETVSFERITYAKGPQKFEAGTQSLASVVGLGAALDYLEVLNMNAVFAHEQMLLTHALPQLSAIAGLRIIGTALPKIGVISFVIDNIHPHDLGTVLDNEGIAVRAGHHCAMPLMARFSVPATVRVSFGIYTTQRDIDALIGGLQTAKRLFS